MNTKKEPSELRLLFREDGLSLFIASGAVQGFPRQLKL
jgi:hypothetical protein